MRERRQRLVLWTGVCALTLLLFIPKGHEMPFGGTSPVAFLHGLQGKLTVRITGEVPGPGVYQINHPATVAQCISQNAPGVVRNLAGEQLLAQRLEDGDVITVAQGRGHALTLAKSSMSARERIVLGVPLDPAKMTSADWEALPGIGPALTERIMTFARHRGGLRTLDELRGVDGIGERTLDKLRPLFN